MVEDKWFTSISTAIEDEVQQVTQHLAERVKVLEERYARTLLELDQDVEELGAKVEEHLKNMGMEF